MRCRRPDRHPTGLKPCRHRLRRRGGSVEHQRGRAPPRLPTAAAADHAKISGVVELRGMIEPRQETAEGQKPFGSVWRLLPFYSTRIWKGRDGFRALERNDCEVALSLWRLLANDGDAEAKYQLGLLYAAGRCVNQDRGKAEKLILGAVRSYHFAAEAWFRREAKAGNANAQFEVALMHLGGLFPERANKLLRSASMQGHPVAQAAWALQNFGGSKQDRGRFARFLLRYRWTAWLFFALPPMNQLKAMKLLEQSAASGSQDGIYVLARFYECGFDFAPDRAKAFEWMAKAAQKGLAAAQLQLARYFRQGIGTDKNRELATHWFETAKANMTKDVDCLTHCMLVGGLIHGDCCEPDLVQACYWANVTDRRFAGKVPRSEMRKLRRLMTRDQIRQGERVLEVL